MKTAPSVILWEVEELDWYPPIVQLSVHTHKHKRAYSPLKQKGANNTQIFLLRPSSQRPHRLIPYSSPCDTRAGGLALRCDNAGIYIAPGAHDPVL